MAHTHDSSNLTLNIDVIRLLNFDLDLPGTLFVRYYVFVGGGRRIRIDTREIRTTSEPFWNELASLDCSGVSDPIGELLERRSVVFELRLRRTTTSVLGRITGSKLLGKGEVAWNDVLGSAGMSLERRVGFVSTSRLLVGCKPPALLVRMKVGVSEPTKKRRASRGMAWKGCDCRECEWNGSQEDMLAVYEL